jgi:hypothetical protein
VRTRALAALSLISVAAFLGFTGIAMARYPGGTWCEPAGGADRLWENFLCDLLHVRSLSGAENPGAGFARLGMLALVAGFLPFWLALPELFRARPRTGLWLRSVGVLSVVSLVLVPLTPSDRFGAMHGIAVMGAGVPGFAAAALAVSAQLGTRPLRALGLLGASALATSLADMAVYVHHFFARVDCAPWLPVVQWLALGQVLVWMAASSLALLGSRA